MKRQRRLRRLVPDPELFRRRAAGEPLRTLGRDYQVSHTTLGRYFGRPEARRQLRQAGQPPRAERHRPLRRLVPDPQLFRRRAAGEPLRILACDYQVSHTTLGRYFARPEARRQLRRAGQLLREERRAAQALRREQRRFAQALRGAQRRFAQEVRRRASEQAAAERRERAAWTKIAARRRRRSRSTYAAFLDRQDLRRPPIRADRSSANDRKAAQVVAAGGGIEAVLEITGLLTPQNLLQLIDPAILKKAVQNDAAAAAAARAK